MYVQAVEGSPGAARVELSKTQTEKERKRQAKATIRVEHTDIIRDDFWDRRPWLLSRKVTEANDA